MRKSKPARKFASAHAGALAGLALAATVLAFAAAPAAAQTPTQIKQNNAWGAYSHNGNNGRICFVLSIPTEKLPVEKDGRVLDHGDVFFMITRYTGQNVRLEPSFTAGYNFADDSKVVLDIDGRKFSMFTREKKAWLENPAEEGAVVAAMKAGRAMTVSAVSRRGTQTTYQYSLSGVTASIGDIESCQ